MSDAQEIKEELLWAAQEMLRSGLVEGTAGNLAARLPDGNAVLTPSSLDYLEMGLDDLVVCDLDGNVVEGHRGPTSEKQLHLAVLAAYPEIGATMHCHAKHVQMFAVTHQPIPAVVEEFDVYVGGDVECSDYKETGSTELAEEVAGASPTAPPSSWRTMACSRAGRARRTRSTSRRSSSGPPRSCGVPVRSGPSSRSRPRSARSTPPTTATAAPGSSTERTNARI